ncbi:metabotropic glutamate receptor 2-like [Macrosteles quadrilineatus]|uniref:metabotropic glutamate receptor 2-like n=1 Tax=Macrosteles quadrilineatus TaxID=74068 RepID=UPI0023E1D001|nr:metabotropic glutamate receptor 2-like [Macrosteles quadrilineatus]
MDVATGLTLILIYQRMVVTGVKVESQNSPFTKPHTTAHYGAITSAPIPTIVSVTESENPADKLGEDYKPEQRANFVPETFETLSTHTSVTSMISHVTNSRLFNESIEVKNNTINARDSMEQYTNKRINYDVANRNSKVPTQILESRGNFDAKEHLSIQPNSLESISKKYEFASTLDDEHLNKPSRRKNVSALDALKTFMKQDETVVISNVTSPLNHLRKFRELTRRRKYSMNFVKSQNSTTNNDTNNGLLSDKHILKEENISELGETPFNKYLNNSKKHIEKLQSDDNTNNSEPTLSPNTEGTLVSTFQTFNIKPTQSPLSSAEHYTYANFTTSKPTTIFSIRSFRSQNVPFDKASSSNTYKRIFSSDTNSTSFVSRSFTPSLRRTSFPTPPTSLAKPSASNDPWPVKLAAETPGDLILGGLMMVHEREDSVTCGPIMPQGGIQALETMLYTLDVINNDPRYPFSIGAHILDDCDKDTYGLEMAVDFIKGSISNIDDAEYHCNKTQIRKVISGVVGAASSVTSIQVANLLRLFKIPQVSFFSTSPELSNKQRFEYFTRTIPSDHHQVKAMVEIVRRLGWSYVSIIYEESNYGIKAFEELEDLLAKYEICIAVKEKLVKDSGVAEDTAYDSIVHRLLTKPRARGAIIFGSDQEVAALMKAVRRCNATGSFSWIGSDGWSARSLVWQGSEAEVEGTLSVQPQANPVLGFDRYFLNLTVENNRRNPWFVEFWEHHFQCRYPNSPRTPYNQRHSHNCTGLERLTADNTVFENQLQFVSDAVMAFAVALRDMHSELCFNKQGLCEHMRPTKGPDLLKYLRKVNFEGLSGDKFRFDANGDGPARYNIIHFKQIKKGHYQWLKVGEYIEGELTLNMSDVQFRLGRPSAPESVCSLPCELGQAKQYVEGESCCWHCFNCTQYQIRHPLDETKCQMCPAGTVPDAPKQRCLDIPEVFLKVESAWAIGAMCFSATGIIITLLVAGVFVRHNNTPVVKAAGRELSYVLLSGILLCYSVTFVLVLRPTDVVCGVQRFGTGFCFTVVYAALFTKTNRISRIFNAGKRTTKRPSFISPRSQIFICSGLVSIQVIINGVWMVVSPPRAIHHYPTREDNLLVCYSYVNASYMIAFGYPILLILVCTVYAVLTRNIPEAFNESKHIGFTMYTTCVIWLAFVPLYFGTGHHMPLRITSMSVTISLSASVTLVCLFSPKLYIILIRPERNVRQSMMPSRHGLFKSGTTASVMVGVAPVTHTHQPFAQVLAEKECIALEINEEAKKVKKEKVPTFSRSTQTLMPSAIPNNKSPTLTKVNNAVNTISSLVDSCPQNSLSSLVEARPPNSLSSLVDNKPPNSLSSLVENGPHSCDPAL